MNGEKRLSFEFEGEEGERFFFFLFFLFFFLFLSKRDVARFFCISSVEAAATCPRFLQNVSFGRCGAPSLLFEKLERMPISLGQEVNL